MDLSRSRADEATRHRLNQVMIDARTAESDKVLQSGKSARGSMAIRCQLDQFAREQQTVDTSGVYERALVSYTRSLELQADEAAGWVLAGELRSEPLSGSRMPQVQQLGGSPPGVAQRSPDIKFASPLAGSPPTL